MNSQLKWDEACPHTAHFHRFMLCANTDEDVYPEKVDDDHSEDKPCWDLNYRRLELTWGGRYNYVVR
jgi:hypothetical protein